MGRTTSRATPRTSTSARTKGRPKASHDAVALWERYHSSRSAKARNALIERYMPLVRAISSRIATELPSCVQVDDLVSVGTFGLMEAIERYNPDLGTRFETYCAVRIRGAILDELRHLNWMPRLQSTRASRVGAATESLRGELGRTPSAEEVARRTGLKVRDVNHAAANGRRHISLSAAPAGSQEDQGMRRMDIVEAQHVCDPADLLEERERREILAREIRKLPAAQRLLVMLYYFEELTMRQIGEILNVTESRVCQMHAGVLVRLQQRLAEFNESGAGRT